MAEIAVDSTCLDSVDYEPSTETMILDFDRGGVYSYATVPQAIYDALIAAASKGTYFNANIRNAGYAYTQISRL